MFKSTICLLLPFFTLHVNSSLQQKYQIKRNTDPQPQPQPQPQEPVHQVPLTLQIPTFIPQFDPNQNPIFDLATTTSFHSLPLVQPQSYFGPPKSQNEELQVAATNSPSSEETVASQNQQVLDSKFKGVLHFPQNQFVPNHFLFEPKALETNSVPTVIPKGVVHLNPQNGQRFQNFRGYKQPKTAAQNLYYVGHPVRYPQINYHVLPVSGHQRQYTPLVYHSHPPPPRFRPHPHPLTPQPIVNSQVRHPVFYGQNLHQTNLHQQNLHLPNLHHQNLVKPQMIYGGFKPIPPQKPEVKEEVNEEINEDPEAVQEQDEEEEEERPRQREEPRKEYRGYNTEDFGIDEFFKNGKYSFPKFAEDEEEEKRPRQQQDRENASYEVVDHESQEAEEEEDEESKKTFVVANPFVTRNRGPNRTQQRPQTFVPSPTIHYGKPKEEYKAFSYSKKINYPKKEIYQGRGSENIPVIHGHKTLHQNWYYTKSTL